MGWRGWLLVVGLWCQSAWGQVSVSGTLRTGAEWDSNITRVEEGERTSGFLSRYFTSAQVRSGGPTVVSLDVTHGGKFFWEHVNSDEFLTAMNLGVQRRFGLTSLFVQGDFRDRTERESVRDYLRGGLGAGVDLGLGDWGLRAGGAGRYFVFKPSASLSSTGLEGFLRGRWRSGGLDLGLGYTVSSRGFDGNRFVLEGDAIQRVSERRRDVSHLVQLTGSWRGPVVVEGMGFWMVNGSNSYGQELTRHGGELVLTAPLPWQMYASAKFEVQRTAYGDRVLVDANFLVDDENRNSLVGSLVRVWGAWEFEVKYSLSLEEFGVGADYRRQTVMMGAGYVFE